MIPSDRTPPIHSTTDVANPYAAPVTIIETELPSGAHYPMADRGTRLLAAILDGIIVGVPGVVIGYFAGWISFEQEQSMELGSSLELFVLYVVIWMVVNYNSLKFGQTIGKKITKIQIVDYETGNIPSLTNLIGVRYFAIWVISHALTLIMPLLALLFVLGNVVMIFGNERRCLHDIMAKTKVVKPQQRG